MKLVLFDIDGTLIQSGGAGSRALNRAFETVFGITDGFRGVRMGGKTDPLIVREAMQLRGVDGDSEGCIDRLFQIYLRLLEEELKSPKNQYRVLSGVRELLEALNADRSFEVGLATGNIEEGARLKLNFGDLDSYFSFGGFGSDSANRTELVEMAIERGRSHSTMPSKNGVFVIGDTPLDIIHGREAGASVVAVATGNYGLRQLEKYDPDALFPDLKDLSTVLEALRQQP